MFKGILSKLVKQPKVKLCACT